MRAKSLQIACVLAVFSLRLATANDSEDHPFVSRYKGSVVLEKSVVDYDQYVMALGPTEQKMNRQNLFEWPLTKSETIAGKVTRIIYRLPDGVSPTAAVATYDAQLTQAKFRTLFRCGGNCGTNFASAVHPKSTPYERLFSPGVYMAAQGADGRNYVIVHASEHGYKSDKVDLGKAVLSLVVVEKGGPATDAVSVQSWKSALDREGHVAIEGLFFDVDSATIKPESRPVVAKIAELLQSEPNLRLFIVGHTDNTGEAQHNIALSTRRAEAVVDALATQHSTDRKRLKPLGVGPVAPVASNRTEEGRARNRRVEIVEQ